MTVHVDETDAPLLHVFVEGEDIRVLKPEAVYDVYRRVINPRTGVLEPLILLRYKLSYEGRERRVERGWRVTLNLIVDAFEVNKLYNVETLTQGGECKEDFVILHRMEFKVLIGDVAWNPPGGVFDPHVQSQRNGLSNVENGLGFIAGGYRRDVALNPSRATVESACFGYGFE